MLRWSAFYIVRRKVFIHNVEVEIRELSFRHGESFRERISIPSPIWNRVDHHLFSYVPGGLWEPAEEGGWQLDSFVHGSGKGCACQGGVESLHSQRNLGLHWEVMVLPRFPLGNQSLVNSNKMVQRGKIKSWQAITNKEAQKGFSERITSHHEKSEGPSCQMANTYVFKLEFLDITDCNPTAYLGTVLPTLERCWV